MGRTASCDLCFGIPLPNNYESDDDGAWVAPWMDPEFSGDIEEWVLRDIQYVEDSTEESQQATYKERRAAWEAFGLGISKSGCYDGDDTEVLCVRASVVSGSWFEATEVDVTKLIDQLEWTEQLKAFCASIGMPWSEPKWYLTVLYG
jgi:hypothetical protein